MIKMSEPLRCIICDRIFLDDARVARIGRDGGVRAVIELARRTASLMCDECLKPPHGSRLGAHELDDLAEHIRRK